MSHLTRIIRFVRHWHARIGVLAAVFFLTLSLTGVALNHTDALKLAKHEISAGWLMRWYGLVPSVPERGFLFSNGYIAASGDRWVMDARVLPLVRPVSAMPVGAADWRNMRTIASAEALYLYSSDGQLVDRIAGGALPGHPVRRLGSFASMLVLETPQGSFATEDGISWEPLTSGQPVWSAEQDLPSSIKMELKQAFSPSLSLERIMLDFHSGRIFGRYGPFIMDMAAVVLALLSVSGVWIYARTVRKKPDSKKFKR